MRERLVAALVGMTIAVIALYGVPRAYFLADLVKHQETRKVERSADLLAVVVAEREQDSAAVDEEFLEKLLNEAEAVEYVREDGTVVTAGEIDRGGSDILATRAVAGGGKVTLFRAGSLIDQRVSDAILPLVLLGLGLTVVSAALGFVLARRMARPFQELAGAATDLGNGSFDLDVPHYKVPEAEQIGSALRRGAGQLSELVRREREFAVNASHQLRTPVTALRLELEDLALWPQTPPEVARELEEALSELDRLSEAITHLLAMARGKGLDSALDLDLARLIAETVERWRPHAETRGRRLVYEGSPELPARLTPGPVAQILDVLIENACSHGDGDITVDADHVGTHLRVRVSDEGLRDFDIEVFRRGLSGGGGTGVGLSLAAELARSLGGRLNLEEGATTRFVLMLACPAPSTEQVRRPDQVFGRR